jgi:hypothetical protein
MEEIPHAYKILLGKLEAKESLGKLMLRREDDIKDRGSKGLH